MKTLATLFMMLLLRATLCAQGSAWYPTEGPFGGAVVAIAAAPNGFVYAASRSNGIFRSADGGATWTNLGLVGPPLATIAVDSSGVVFAATKNAELFRSTSLGASWERLLLGPGINSLAIDRSRTLVATAYNQVHHSSDVGASWRQIQFPIDADLRAVVVTGNGFYATGPKLVYRSQDGGATWSSLTPAPDDLGPITAITVTSRGDIYIGNTGLYVSRNSGKTWERTPLAGQVLSLASAPSGAIYAGTYHLGLFRSTDNGEHWSSIGRNALSVSALTLAHGERIFAGTHELGVVRYDDATAWMAGNMGLTATAPTSITLGRDGTLVVGSNAGVFSSTTRGYPWTSRGLETITTPSAIADRDGVLFAGSEDYETNGGIYRLDNGQWRQIGLWGAMVYKITHNSAGDLFALYGPFRMRGGKFGISRSTDHGTTWTDIIPSEYIRYTGATELIFTDGGGMLALANGLLRSNDDAKTWEREPGAPVTLANALLIDLDGTMFSGSTQDGIYRSSDNGRSWTQTGLTGMTVTSIVRNDRGWLYAASQNGVHRSVDQGDSWEPIVTGEPGTSVGAIVIDADGFAYAAASDGNIYRSPGSTTSAPIRTESSRSPAILSLSPNPGAGHMELRYSLPRRAVIRISIHDAAGNEIVGGADRHEEAGIHDAVIDATTLPSGGYRIRISTGTDVAAINFIVIR